MADMIQKPFLNGCVSNGQALIICTHTFIHFLPN